MSADKIFYNPFGASNALIGTWAGGGNGADLVVNLNNNADSTAVDALIQRITYANNSNNPSTAERTVTFSLNDGDGGPGPVGTATATINVTAVNDAPAAHNDFIAIGFVEDTAATIAASVLLANDTDVDNHQDLLSITGVSDTSAHGGTVTLNGSVITYNPLANYNGADSFTYTISDGSLTSTATVSFNVAAVNDAPIIIAPSQLEYWTGSTIGDVAIVNQISFADADAGKR